MPKDLPREPMPKSFRPVWVYFALMAGLVVVIGIASAIVALLIR